MYLTALHRTIRQIPEPAFLKVLALGILLAALALAVASLAAGALQPMVYESEQGWINTVLGVLFYLFALWLSFILFVPITALFVGLFLDAVVDAVETRYYPSRPAGPPLGVARASWLGMRLAILLVIYNIAAIPLYILTIWIPFAAVVIFYGINAYLLGWGFYDLVATRHLDPEAARRHRRSHKMELLVTGLLITFVFTIPILNLSAPILGAAFFVHVFHATLDPLHPERF